MKSNNAPAAVPMSETNQYMQGKTGTAARKLMNKMDNKVNKTMGGGINRSTRKTPQR